MRKLFIMLFALGALLLSATGCSAPPEEEGTSSQESVADLDSTPVERPATVLLEPATEENPYPLPIITAPEPDPADITEAVLNALVKRFCFDLFDSCRTLTVPDFSEYVEDNVETHLAIRWPEYFIHDIRNSPRKQVVEVTSVWTGSGNREEHAHYVSYRVMCELRYDRKDPSVNGCNVDTGIRVAEREGKLKIVSFDLVFNSAYRELLEDIRSESEETGGVTIELIDRAFDELIN